MERSEHFLYKITPTRIGMVIEGPTREEAAIVEEHLVYLTELAEKGTVLLFGRTTNLDANVFGIVIFKADSKESAMKIMNNDPAVRKGVMSAELYPYRIAFMAGAKEE
jgi:uncharacterized protein YciI